GTVRAQIDAVSRPTAVDRRRFRRLPRRRRRAADNRTDLASHATAPKPQLGPSATHPLHRTAGCERKKDWLERSPGRRHVTTSRRADAFRANQSSKRPRRRYLGLANDGTRG